MEQIYAALWVNLAPDNKSIRMACDNEEGWDAENRQVPFANCISVQDRFYCAAHGLKPLMNGLVMHVRICSQKEIGINHSVDVAKLFELAVQITGALDSEASEELLEAGKTVVLYIWDKVEQTLIRYYDGKLEQLEPGIYTAVYPQSIPQVAACGDDYEYFENLRAALGLPEFPNIRAKFDWSGDANWMYQGITGGELPEELVNALAPIIQRHLMPQIIEEKG